MPSSGISQQSFRTPLGADIVAASLPAGEIGSVLINNPTGSWLTLFPTFDFVPPYTLGFARSFEMMVVSVTLRFTTGPSGEASTLVGNPVTMTLYTGAIGNNPGYSNPPPETGYGTSNVQGIGTGGVPLGGVLSVQGVAGGTAIPVSGALVPVGTQTVQGSGTAGAQAGGVLTVQGDPAGTPIPVSGSFTPTGNTVIRPVDNFQSFVGAVNTGGNLTIAAPGVGQRIYITHIRIARVATAALAGGALLTVTTANLGGRQWRTGNQASITVGTFENAVLMDQEFAHPIPAVVNNLAVTLTFPAPGAAVSWDALVEYYIAP